MSIPDNLIEQVILNSGDEFDSHDIIHKLAHENQKLYIENLNEMIGERPFQTLHSILGRKIKDICERLGYHGIASRSLDIFGQYGECVRWSKN
ncbi:MAG: hypothetical protein HF314_02035 [Ignavibacteria bacterium]|nr:hypothetical protein [Ignavibacteria bacterium]MCU7501824.1 hypothetical protein [Ignavibacteria bacterium]MCU7514830.1 hypothetical protein [Ignavibacteria bacterium]